MVPDWQEILQLPLREFQQGTFVFKVSLAANLWRQIFIPETSTLEDLSDAILRAYSFHPDHLYRFLYASRFGTTCEVLHPYMDRGPYVHEVRIGDLPARPGFRMMYHFDFGDDWWFEVQLERIDPPDERLAPYRIGEGKGKAPEQYPVWD